MPITNKMSRQGSRTSLLARLAQSRRSKSLPLEGTVPLSHRHSDLPLRGRLACLAACLLASCVPGSALAAESALPTTQAKAYGADWVPYLDPPAKPAAVCLVDSGINITPDTPPDSPDGPILERSALDGGTGEAAGSSWEQLHGTRMAMAATAPINGWGTVGFAPGVRIVSVRAMPTGKTTFPFDDYRRAIKLCGKRSDPAHRVLVVNVSLGCGCVRTPAEEEALIATVAEVQERGKINVVASAGNNGREIGSPANLGGVISVGAGDPTGELCGFSNRGPGLDLIGPGCGTDLADPLTGDTWTGYSSGSSGAAAAVSVGLALLRSYRPDLSWDAAEQLAVTSARPSLDGRVFDLKRAFEAAGLGSMVAQAAEKASREAKTYVDNSEPDSTASADALPPANLQLDAGTTRPRWIQRPRLRSVRPVGRALRIAVSNRPRRARLIAVVERRAGEFGWTTLEQRIGRTGAIRVRAPARPARLRLVFKHAGATSSPAFRWLR